MLPLTEQTHTEAAVYYAYLARARSSSQLREVADNIDTALLRLCRDVVSALAPSLDPEGRAHELHALTEGLSFALVTWPHRRSAATARTTLHDWLQRLADEDAEQRPPAHA